MKKDKLFKEITDNEILIISGGYKSWNCHCYCNFRGSPVYVGWAGGSNDCAVKCRPNPMWSCDYPPDDGL
jgi:hypothetical protein